MGSNAWEVPMWAGMVGIATLTALIVFRAHLSVPVLIKAISGNSVDSKKPASGVSFDLFKQLSSAAVLLAAVVIVVLKRESLTIGTSISVLIAAAAFAACRGVNSRWELLAGPVALDVRVVR
jgi:hypothetical protein